MPQILSQPTLDNLRVSDCGFDPNLPSPTEAMVFNSSCDDSPLPEDPPCDSVQTVHVHGEENPGFSQPQESHVTGLSISSTDGREDSEAGSPGDADTSTLATSGWGMGLSQSRWDGVLQAAKVNRAGSAEEVSATAIGIRDSRSTVHCGLGSEASRKAMSLSQPGGGDGKLQAPEVNVAGRADKASATALAAEVKVSSHAD